MTMTKRFFAFVTACSMLGTLAGCSTGMTDESTALTAAVSENAAPAAEQTADKTYADLLFDSSYVHTIDITIQEADWTDLKENPLNKTKYETDITIDGETFQSVSFATKGNTSLSFVADDPDSDRYSFKVNFGKYTEGQTYHGLDKLNLNNLYADATYMKDFLSYEIFRQAGVDAPLVSYVWLTVNGEEQGLYVAIEEVGESYLDRTENGEGELYKPEAAQLDQDGKGFGGKMPEGFTPPENGEMPEGFTPPENGEMLEGFTPPENGEMPEGFTPPENGEMPEGFTPPENGEMPEGFTPSENGEMPEGFTPPENGEMPERGGQRDGMPGGFGGFGDSANGASLAYSDDEISSYADIFDNAETGAEEADMQRVIAALKGLSEGTDLESCLDTVEVIRYFAAHNFVLNYDSYTGNMLHNYYLYENGGKLSMLPWDYNLAFGGFGGGPGQGGNDATSLINTGIDTPLSGAEASSRPMWAWIAGNETYLAQYHAVYDELLQKYFESGEFEQQIDALYEMLLPYVEKQTSAFYTADEFKAGYAALRQFCLLRAESIRAQLSGTLAASTSEQEDAAKISADGLELKDMGSNGGGKGMPFGGGQGNFPGRRSQDDSQEDDGTSRRKPDFSRDSSRTPGRFPQNQADAETA